MLQAFETLRRANIALWNRTDEAARSRVGIHAERGPESLELSFRLIAGHDRLHLEQARMAEPVPRRKERKLISGRLVP